MILRPDTPVVLISARTAAWLERYAGLTTLRVRVRGTDPQISHELEDIRVAAMTWVGSASGTQQDTEPELAPRSEWLSTTQAAEELDMTDRGIRKAIASRRLTATVVAGRHRITREALTHFDAARHQQGA